MNQSNEPLGESPPATDPNASVWVGPPARLFLKVAALLAQHTEGGPHVEVLAEQAERIGERIARRAP